MSWWDRVRALLRREAADAKEIADELEAKLDEELTRREEELDASPEEHLQATLDQIAASDDAYERFKDELEEGHKPQEG